MKYLTYLVGALLLVFVVFILAGDYVYRTGTKVLCGVHEYHQINTPASFYTPGKNNGPFKGSGWDKWVGYDLSGWWVDKNSFSKVEISNDNKDVVLVGWWMKNKLSYNKTVVVVHGLNTNRQDFNVILPANMIYKSGFNVLLIDLRDSGESTCQDSRHSAGQQEADDILSAVNWLNKSKGIETKSIGIHGISGGAIAAMVASVKNKELKALSLESPIFDFNKAAKDEVIYQGFPGFLWTAAYWAARIRGVDLMAISPIDAIKNIKNKKFQLLHGQNDSRVKYSNSLDMVTYAKSLNVDIPLYTFEGADHTEGLLTDTKRYSEILVNFFNESL